jgi:hypothetical protein
MIRKLTLAVVFFGLLHTTFASAGEALTQRFRRDSSGDSFASPETTLDVFGSLKVPDGKGLFDGDPGIGVGVNHFFTRNFGLGADTGVDKFDWPNHVNASLIGRYPIPKWSLAPYLFAGFGRQFHDVAQWTYHFGGGVDYRINHKTGVFLDVGETWPDVSKNFLLWRLGLRLGF